MLFKMRVNGMLPIVSGVNEFPILRTVLLDGEAKFVAVRKSIVDCPLSIVAVKPEVARDSRRNDTGQLVKLRMGGWVNAVIRYRGADLKLHTRCTLASGEDAAAWSLAVVLPQAVLQADLGVAANQILNLVEVNDDVITLSHTESDAGDLDRRGEQVVISNHPEGNHRARAQRIGEEELVIPRRSTVQNAETVAPLVDTQERFESSICQLDVAEQAFEIEGVETDFSGRRIQQLVVQDNRNVELGVAG